MRLAGALLCLPALVASRPAAAQPVQPAQPVTLIRAGRLVDVEKGEVLLARTVVVRGNRILGIEAAAFPAPAGARVIDLSGATVLPGLIDCHTHLIGAIQSAGPGSILEESAAQAVFSGVKHAKRTLLAGFTSVRDVGTYRVLLDAALRDAIDEGTVPGPRMAVAGAYVTTRSGAGDVTGIARDVVLPRDFDGGIARNADEVRQRVRELLNGGANFIKIMATGAVLTAGTQPGVPEFSEAEIRAAVEEAAKYGARVTAHAHGAQGIKNAVRAGVQSIEHGSLLDDEGIRLMRERGTFLVADIYNGDYIAVEGKRLGWSQEVLRKNDETTETQRAAFRKAVAAGVKIAYGTDSGVYPHGLNARQLPYMVKYGMTPIGAIRAATIDAARNIGWEDRVGSIAKGKLADVIAVEGDALADLTRFMDVAFVMKDGVVYKEPAAR